jgi:hypothetical protein
VHFCGFLGKGIEVNSWNTHTHTHIYFQITICKWALNFWPKNNRERHQVPTHALGWVLALSIQNPHPHTRGGEEGNKGTTMPRLQRGRVPLRVSSSLFAMGVRGCQGYGKWHSQYDELLVHELIFFLCVCVCVCLSLLVFALEFGYFAIVFCFFCFFCFFVFYLVLVLTSSSFSLFN